MSKLETNTIDNISGSSTLNLGDTNATAITIDSGVSTLTIPNGIATGHMYPAFEAYRSSDQSISDNVNTKIQFNQTTYDIGNYFDTTTNYRYTPLVSGKYYFYAQVLADALGGSDLRRVQLFIIKNGSNIKSSSFMMETNRLRQATPFIAVQIEMNGTTDYVETFTQIDDNSGSPNIESGVRASAMGGYRLGA